MRLNFGPNPLIERSYKCAVVVWYDHAGKRRGDMVAAYETYDEALKQANESPEWLGVCYLDDYA